MTCENCLNLKVKSLNYEQLRRKWDEIYAPASITEGYEKRMLREAIKKDLSFDEMKFRYVYCAKGMLGRFYIIRGHRIVKPKAGRQYCQFYT